MTAGLMMSRIGGDELHAIAGGQQERLCLFFGVRALSAGFAEKSAPALSWPPGPAPRLPRPCAAVLAAGAWGARRL